MYFLPFKSFSMLSEIRKLPCFDIEIPTSCMEKWDALYEEYRKDMTNACSKAKDEVKDEAAEVLKIYKQVNFSSLPPGLYFQIFHYL